MFSIGLLIIGLRKSVSSATTLYLVRKVPISNKLSINYNHNPKPKPVVIKQILPLIVVHPDGHIIRRSGLGPHGRRYHSGAVHFDDLVRFLLEGIVNRETFARLLPATPGTAGPTKASGRVHFCGGDSSVNEFFPFCSGKFFSTPNRNQSTLPTSLAIQINGFGQTIRTELRRLVEIKQFFPDCK